MSRQIRIIVADDHPLYREGVARTLAGEPDCEVVAEAADADAAIGLAAEHRPDIVLLDISMPGGGIAAIGRIAAVAPQTRTAMLTVSENDDDVMEALKAGALGYILKGVGGQELIAIVRDLAAGNSYVSPSLAARLLKAFRQPGAEPRPSDRLSDLTKREEDILRLVAQGLSNKEIGRALDLQEKTVKHYMTAILQKLHVRNRVEAAVLARDVWSKSASER